LQPIGATFPDNPTLDGLSRLMTVKLQKAWETARASYWFVPTLMTVGAMALAFGMLALDTRFGDEVVDDLGWIFSGGPEGARQVLSTVASSMITVAGVAFSITIVALSLASSQFGPRVLYNFMRDTGNQVVLGTFIATFIYCLLILRSVQGEFEGASFVPAMSVTMGVMLAVASLGVLIFFIHHTAISIQAPQIVAAIHHDLGNAIDRLFPAEVGEPVGPSVGEDAEPENFEVESWPLKAPGSGYLQVLDDDRLMELAKEHDLLLRLECRSGHFITPGQALLRVWPAERLADEVRGELCKTFLLGPQRTHVQDAEFAINQLVEVAVRSLSTGINDPFTAINCVDQLSAALTIVAGRAFPSPYRRDDRGALRVIAAKQATFGALVDAAFNQIRQNSHSVPAVTLRLLEALASIAQNTGREDYRDVLRRHAEMIRRGSLAELTEENDRRDVEERYWAALEALDPNWAAQPVALRPRPVLVDDS
jgi:uncharacterized membrane protein